MSSPTPRAVCITSDPALRRTLRRTLQASGSLVEFRDSPEGGPGGARILFIDYAAGRAIDMSQLMQIMGEDGKIIFLGASLEDDEVVALLRNQPMDHVISDAPEPDEIE